MAKMHPFHRTELLVGGAGYARLKTARICVVGLGGVGSYAAEALVRSGVGHLTLVDFDRVCITNLNRQLHATRDTIGAFKAEVMGERSRAINPKADVVVIPNFYCEELEDQILSPGFDWVLDCIDNMTAKLHLVEACWRRGQPLISSMGAGGLLDPTRVRVTPADVVKNDPFAKILRKNLRRRGVPVSFPAVWSDELPNDLDAEAQSSFRCICPDKDVKQVHSCESRMIIQGSVGWMPPIFGLTMAGWVANQLVTAAAEEGAA